MTDKRKTRTSYSAEFKVEAVAKCLKTEVKKTSEELGVTTQTLNNWVLKSKANAKRAAGKPTYEELERENRKLKKENGYINEINHVLKKSTAIFSSHEMGSFR